jgi:hypothetical protein
MGDRANIKLKIESDKPALYIYSHWSGSELPTLLQSALKAAMPRKGDWSYFTRILVDQVTAGGRDEETGWGLGFWPDDNEHNLLVVDYEAGTITACAFDDDSNEHEGAVIATVTFAEFVALPDPNGWRDPQ